MNSKDYSANFVYSDNISKSAAEDGEGNEQV